METLAFGPIPSRRLGRSLGINNIPAKTCTYSCVYCQLGETADTITERRVFYNTDDILKDVKRKVDEAFSMGEDIDYLTFVPDGEPTLDINLGQTISSLKNIGIPIAVLTNASLIWQEDVKEDLFEADLVSLKVDAVGEDLWERMDRPHKNLKLSAILEGISDFVKEFRGSVISETMLLGTIDYTGEFGKIAYFLEQLRNLEKAYIAIPTRPPTESWVRPAKEEMINLAFQVFSEKLGRDKVEYLIGYEGDSFASTGNAEDDLLSITAVHPMRKEAVEKFLKKAKADWELVNRLLQEDELTEVEYEGNRYYMRILPSRRKIQ